MATIVQVRWWSVDGRIYLLKPAYEVDLQTDFRHNVCQLKKKDSPLANVGYAVGIESHGAEP